MHLAVTGAPDSQHGGRAAMKEQNVIGTMQLLAAAQGASRLRKYQPTRADPIKLKKATRGSVARRSASALSSVTKVWHQGSARPASRRRAMSSRQESGVAAAGFTMTGQPTYADLTEETYVGLDRREPGTFALAGDWSSTGQYVELQTGSGELAIAFTAGEVNLVVQPGPTGAAEMAVLLDRKPIGAERGADVDPDAVARIDRSGMIRLVTGALHEDHVLTLIADPGLRAYVFTFGP